MSGHGIDVCRCGAVLRQCRCMGPHTPRVVQQSCPACMSVVYQPPAEPPALDCGSHSCRFATSKTGMRTNGHCRCLQALSSDQERAVHRYVAELRQKLAAAEASLANWKLVASEALAEMTQKRDAAEEERDLLRAVERELPQCECCQRPATRTVDHHSYDMGPFHLCDEHDFEALAIMRNVSVCKLTGPYPIGYEDQLRALNAWRTQRGGA